MKKIILASQSPRRREILKNIGLEFGVVPSDIDETMEERGTIIEKIEALALKKAINVAEKIKEESWIIAADTVVLLDDVLGKPSNVHDARQMLTALLGKTHQVITGVALVDVLGDKKCTGHEITQVTMRNYDSSDIESYIASGECFDKAGSYGIQGLGALLVKEIKGDYFNVVGLPLGLLDQMFRKMGLTLFSLTEYKK